MTVQLTASVSLYSKYNIMPSPDIRREKKYNWLKLYLNVIKIGGTIIQMIFIESE